MDSRAFRDESEAVRGLQRRIMAQLDNCHAVHIAELCQRLAYSENAVRAALDTMMDRGDVERLRPVNYDKGDHDFFASMRSLERAQTCGGEIAARFDDVGANRVPRRFQSETFFPGMKEAAAALQTILQTASCRSNNKPKRRNATMKEMGALLAIGLTFSSLGAASAGPSDVSSAGAATTATNRAETTAFSVPEIVVTASRMARDIQAEPSAVYRLDGNAGTLRAANRTTPDMLEGVPSVMLQKTSHGQTSPYLRGCTGYRTLCLIDGIRLNNSVFRSGPNQYWNTVDPLSISSYEMVMGPGSVLYGSDAIGGVLNALTLDPPDWTGDPAWERRVYYRGSSAERSNVGRVQLGGRISEQLGFTGGYSLKSFGDLRGGKDVGVQEHTGYDEQDFDAKLNWYIDKNSTFTLGHQSVRQDDAWRTHRTIYGIDWEGLTHGDFKVESYDQQRDLTYMRYRAEKLGGFADAIEMTLSRHAQGEDMYRLKADDKAERVGFDAATWGGTCQFESQSAFGQWVYGLDYYHDIVASCGRKYKADGSLDKIEIQGTVADDASYDMAGIFAQDTISCLGGKLDVIPGFRYTFAAADANKIKDPITGERISLNNDWQAVAGSLRMLFPLTPDRRHALYAGVSQGFRAPSLMDLSRFDVARSGNELEVAAPDLDPENFVACEIGFKSRTTRLVSQISCYHTAIDGMIVRTPTGRIVEGRTEVTKKNSGDGYIRGVELSETYNLTPNWSTRLAATWQEGEADTYPSASATEKLRDDISRIMPPTAEVGLRWQSDGAGYWCELVGNAAAKADKLSVEDELDTSRIPPGGTPGYAVCHLRAGSKIARNLDVALALENILDEDYRIHGSGVNEPGRNVILTAAWDF